MTLHDASSLIRDAGGEVWNITAEQGASVLYATVNGQNCRIIVPRAGQPAPKPTAATGFVTHVATDTGESKRWLSTISERRGGRIQA